MANLADHLFRQACERGNKVALHYEGRTTTFAELADQVRAAAGGLLRAGIGSGTRVGLMATSRPEFIIYQQALFAIGAVVSPLNIFYLASELLHAVESCELEALVLDSAFLDRLPAVNAPGAGSLATVVLIDGGEGHGDSRVRSGAALIASSQPIRGPLEKPAEALGMLLNTSATTGKSKGVMLSLGNIAANYDRTPGWLGLDEQSIICCALPLYNTFGLNQCINALMVTGGTLVLMSRFEAGACIDAIEHNGCNFFPCVPTMLQKIVDHPDAERRDLGSIRTILTGGAPVPAALLERVRHVMRKDAAILTGYGLTEGTALATLDSIELDEAGKILRPKSIGRPLPTTEIRIVTDDGRTAAAGETGEIWLRGPLVMQGYYKRPDATAEALTDGWLRTGDIGLSDPDGYLYIVDRKKDVIIRGGQNIYPADIEEVLYRVPGVCEAAVIGMPDDVLGEVPQAFLAFSGGQQVSTQTLIAACEQELARYKIPTKFHILPELPKGATGKILHRSLRDQSVKQI